MSAPARVEIAPEIRAVLSAEMTARLLAGQVGPADYHCVICHQPGGLATHPTSAVLFDPDRAPVLSWAHRACSPSCILPTSHLPPRIRQHARPDLVGTPVLLDLDRRYAGLLLRPRDTVLAMDDRQLTDVLSERVRAAGLVPVDGPLRQPPPVLSGWRISIGGDGHIGPITRRGLRAGSRTWWTPPPALVATREWVSATRIGAVVLLVSGVDAEPADLAGTGTTYGGSVRAAVARHRTH